jgi:hypothetical protein
MSQGKHKSSLAPTANQTYNLPALDAKGLPESNVFAGFQGFATHKIYSPPGRHLYY